MHATGGENSTLRTRDTDAHVLPCCAHVTIPQDKTSTHMPWLKDKWIVCLRVLIKSHSFVSCLVVHFFMYLIRFLHSAPHNNTHFNDLTTAVVASEITDTMEVGQFTSPLFSQEREVSANPFGVSDFQHQAAASGSQQRQAFSSVVDPWQDTDLWSSGKPCEALSHFQVLKDLCREEKGIEISKACNFLSRNKKSVGKAKSS